MVSTNSIRQPHSSPSSATSKKRLNPDTVQRAVNALLKWKKLQNTYTQNPQLLLDQPQSDDDFIYLLLTLKKIPPKDRTTPYKIPLLHPLQESLSSSELCLIIDDRPKSNPKFKLTSEAAKKKIKSEDIPITKVLKLSKLKSDYRSFEAKRKLYDSYDIFFADKRVVHLLPKLLGKQFYKKKKKVPVPVDLGHGNWKEQIERACNSALLCLSSGTCSVVRVGKGSMGRKEIVENVVKVIDEVVEVVPRKWAGVRSFHLKFSESLALPIYQAFPDMKLKIEGIKKNVELKEEFKKDEENIDDKKGSLKKGGIREVRYMDVKVDEDELLSDDDEEDENESEKSEDNEIGSREFVGKKRKEADLVMIDNKRAKEIGNADR